MSSSTAIFRRAETKWAYSVSRNNHHEHLCKFESASSTMASLQKHKVQRENVCQRVPFSLLLLSSCSLFSLHWNNTKWTQSVLISSPMVVVVIGMDLEESHEWRESCVSFFRIMFLFVALGSWTSRLVRTTSGNFPRCRAQVSHHVPLLPRFSCARAKSVTPQNIVPRCRPVGHAPSFRVQLRVHVCEVRSSIERVSE